MPAMGYDQPLALAAIPYRSATQLTLFLTVRINHPTSNQSFIKLTFISEQSRQALRFLRSLGTVSNDILHS